MVYQSNKGKGIRIGGYNYRKNEQDFYGLGHDYSTIIDAMKRGRDFRLNFNGDNYSISLLGFTKSYNQACR